MKLMEENAEPRKYKKCTPADKEVLAKLMRDDITLEETDLGKAKKKIWEDKRDLAFPTNLNNKFVQHIVFQ